MTLEDIEYQWQYSHLDRRLGRNVVHDRRSRGFAVPLVVDRSTWRDKSVRIYDPTPNPNQEIGCCTFCAASMMLNQAGNRVTGRVLDMDDAVYGYSLATRIDPFLGDYPPDDTGSSGLAAAKAAKQLGVGANYFWLFGGADQVVQTIMEGRVVSVGTRWDWDMFNQDANYQIHPGGGEAGGHQWIVRGYWKSRDLLKGRCWWGDFKDFWIARSDLQSLLDDNGDAYTQNTGTAKDIVT